MLADLMAWARGAGLLHGQRPRHTEAAIRRLRNEVAHPNRYELVMPNETDRTMSDLAEIINRLWGQPTPGGHLYPAPLRREILTLGRSREGGSVVALAEHLAELAAAIDIPLLHLADTTAAAVQAAWCPACCSPLDCVTPRPARLAFTALLLILMRTLFARLRDLMPAGHFEYLAEPGVLPVCLNKFFGDVAVRQTA